MKKWFTSKNTFLQCIVGMAGKGVWVGSLARIPSEAAPCLISPAVLPICFPPFGCLLQAVVPSGLMAASEGSVMVSLNTWGRGSEVHFAFSLWKAQPSAWGREELYSLCSLLPYHSQNLISKGSKVNLFVYRRRSFKRMGWVHISLPWKCGVMAFVLETTSVYAAATNRELVTVFFPIIILIPVHTPMCSAVRLEKETSGKQNHYQINVAHWPWFHTQDIENKCSGAIEIWTCLCLAHWVSWNCSCSQWSLMRDALSHRLFRLFSVWGTTQSSLAAWLS